MNRGARGAYVALIVAALVLGVAWVSIEVEPAPTIVRASGASPTQAPDLSHLTRQLPAGRFLVGVGIADLTPDRRKVQWDGPKTRCVKEDATLLDPGVANMVRAVAAGQIPPGWPKSPNCVYLGGNGLGPVRPASGIDSYAGTKVRSIAISNGKDVVLWQSLDLAGFFSRYRSDLCPKGCGALDLREEIASATYDKVPVANIAVNSTHTHGGADGYGAWGGIPNWYRAQIYDRALKSAYDALRDLAPATIAVGAVDARSFNSERRDTYYSAADYGAVWLQARKSDHVIATLVNFAAHPTVLGDENTTLHADWTGTAAKELGDALGGEGIVMQGALGNVSPSVPRAASADLTGDHKIDDYDNVIQMARDFTSYVAADIARGGHVLTSNRITAKSASIAHPVTNPVETPGVLLKFLDREFVPATKGANGPSTYRWAKSTGAPLGRECVTVGPLSLKTDVSSYRIGELTVVTGPGELFGTMAQVVKSKARKDAWSSTEDGDLVPAGQTMVFGQTQDALGYVIQHFEVDPAGGVTSNSDPALGEYEEEFMVDRCFGDHVLQSQLQLIRELN